MTIQTDFQEVGENYLEHYGKMGMKWGHRKSGGAKDIRAARKALQPGLEKIKAAKRDVRSTGKGSAERVIANKALAKVKTEHLKNPDRVLANRLTRGEKTAAILLLQGGLGVVLATSARSRRIEYKQDTGQYK